MAKIRGRDIGLYVHAGASAPADLTDKGDYTAVGLVTSRNMDRSRNAIDVSDADSGDDMDYLAGRRGRTLNVEGHYDATHEAGYVILKAAYDAAGTESIYWLLSSGETGDKQEYGRGIVTALNLSGDDDAAATFSAVINVIAKPVENTIS